MSLLKEIIERRAFTTSKDLVGTVHRSRLFSLSLSHTHTHTHTHKHTQTHTYTHTRIL
jgi:hypothetical protein